MYKKFFKRFIDIIASALVLIILSPVLLIVTIVLLICNRGNAFFFQTRPGKNSKPFKIVKFKTMNDRTDKNGKLLPDKQRITKFGAFVRKSSIDELPQLWNVLKGDMSLLGPRPLLMQYLELYSPEQARRHEVRPGISGWAQCHGRNNLTWTEKFKLDVWYVDNISFKTDCNIVLTTFKNVVRKADIDNNSSTQYTTEPFNGKN